MKIAGFAQLHNELENGNLHNWFRSMDLCDYIYIYDQASTDGSQEVYAEHGNTVVIQSEVNDFKNEMICKQRLLDKLLGDHPETDWILWLDGDTLLDGRLLAGGKPLLHSLCAGTSKNGISLLHYNLWRSDVYYRLDNKYDDLFYCCIPLWRNTGSLRFDTGTGFHRIQIPRGLDPYEYTKFGVIHRGFATDEQILKRHATHRRHGVAGWPVERLVDERGLRVAELPRVLLPSWFQVTDDLSPVHKIPLQELYRDAIQAAINYKPRG